MVLLAQVLLEAEEELNALHMVLGHLGAVLMGIGEDDIGVW